MQNKKDYCKRLLDLKKELVKDYKNILNHQKKHTKQSGLRVISRFLTKDNKKFLRLILIWFEFKKKFKSNIKKLKASTIIKEIGKFECDNLYFKVYYLNNKDLFKYYKDYINSKNRYTSSNDLMDKLTTALIKDDEE